MFVAMAVEPCTKGIGIRGYLDAVGSLHGSEARQKVLDALPQHVRRIAQDDSMRTKWVKVSDFFAVYDVVTKVLFDGDYSKLIEIGRQQVRNDMSSGIYRIFMKVISPSWAVKRAPMFWRLYHDSGELIVEEKEPKHIIGRVNYPIPHPGFWWDQIGSFVGVLEAAGAENVRWTITGGGGSNDTYITGVFEYD